MSRLKKHAAARVACAPALLLQVKGATVETEMCFPPDPTGGRALADSSPESATGG
jgi:hypothetical protein